jgi:Family of unknown function (DUF6345)
MIRISFVMTTLALLPKLTLGFPISMDIGTFAIDNYAGNGGGGVNLSFQIAAGQNFFAGANTYVPSFSASTAAPGLGTSGPSFALDKRDTYVTKSAITSTSSSYGSREYCDFVFYGGHGLVGGLFLGSGGSYGTVAANEFNLGMGYTRWFLANGCSLFNTVAAPATAYQTTFKGLKAMLSFKSVVYDNNLSWELYQEFWLNWTYRDKSLLNAFFDAQTNYGYKHLYPSKGLEPGCLSAQVAVGRIDYCREPLRYVTHDYVAATANSGYYYSRIIGTPQY